MKRKKPTLSQGERKGEIMGLLRAARRASQWVADPRARAALQEHAEWCRAEAVKLRTAAGEEGRVDADAEDALVDEGDKD